MDFSGAVNLKGNRYSPLFDLTNSSKRNVGKTGARGKRDYEVKQAADKSMHHKRLTPRTQSPTKENKKLALALVKKSPYKLEHLGPRLQGDRELVEMAIKGDGDVLKFASLKLRANIQLVQDALRQILTSKELKDPVTFALEGIRGLYSTQRSENGIRLYQTRPEGHKTQYHAMTIENEHGERGFLPRIKACEFLDRIQNDSDFSLLLKEKKFWSGLTKIDAGLMEYKEIVSIAVRNNGLALEYASKEFKEDKDVVLAAVRSDARAISYSCNVAIQQNKEVIKSILISEGGGHMFNFLAPEFKKDKDVALAAVSSVGKSLKFMHSFRFDREVVLAAVKQHGSSLAFASNGLKKDKGIVLQAVMQNGWAIEFVDPALRKDIDVLTATWKKNPVAYKKYCKSFL